MSTLDLNDVPETVEKTEKAFLWLIKTVLRGTRFRRCVFLLVIVVLFGNPPAATKAFDWVGMTPPFWYSNGFYILVSTLLVAAIAIGFLTIPKDLRPPAISIRGLLPLVAGDSELFNKLRRDVDCAKVLAAMLSDRFRFGILVGTSGSGKTSFLQAGIVPRLSAGGTQVICVGLSNEPPMTAIDRAIKQSALKAPAGVLILDQFEQFFLHQPSAVDRKPLIEALKSWFDRESGVRVLISIRAEDAWQMIEIQEAVGYELTNENHFRLLKFDLESAAEVLGVLCEEAGIVFERSFARRIIERELLDSDGRVSPVNLGVIVMVLASKRAAFTADSFKTHGGIAILLEEWLQTQLDAVKMQGLDIAITRTLTALCDFETNRRAGALTEEAIATRLNKQVPLSQISKAITWLVRPDVRLAVKTERSHPVAYQLSHERLIPAIRKAAGYVLDDAMRANELLERRVRVWVENERASRYLLNFNETTQVIRQQPYILWGENRDQKQALLRQSKVRLQRRFALTAVACLTIVLGYAAWCTNSVQRHYMHWKLRNVAEVYQSATVARALAAAGDLELANAVLEKTGFSSDFEGENARSLVFVTATVAALLDQNPVLLGKARSMAEGIEDEEVRQSALAQICRELAIARDFTNALDLAMSLGAKRAEAVTYIVAELAKTGRAKDALKLVQSLKDIDSGSICILAVLLVDVGAYSEAKSLIPMLKESTIQNLACSSSVLAKVGQFEEARNFALGMRDSPFAGLETSTNALRSIAVEMAKQGRLNGNTNLLTKAKEFADSLEWTDVSLERWQIAELLRDHADAARLLQQAWTEIISNHQQGGTMPQQAMSIPRTIASLAVDLKDWKLIDLARREARKLDRSYISQALEDMVPDVAQIWGPVKAKEIVEESQREYVSLFQERYSTAKLMAELGYLNRARYLAENTGGRGQELADALAQVVIGDVTGRSFHNRARPSMTQPSF